VRPLRLMLDRVVGRAPGATSGGRQMANGKAREHTGASESLVPRASGAGAVELSGLAYRPRPRRGRAGVPIGKLSRPDDSAGSIHLLGDKGKGALGERMYKFSVLRPRSMWYGHRIAMAEIGSDRKAGDGRLTRGHAPSDRKAAGGRPTRDNAASYF
jgi:hypothetical protein